MLVDSHCHLNLCLSPELLIERAKKSNVSYMQTICTELQQIPNLIQIAEQAEGIFVSVGVHPCSVKTFQQIPEIDDLKNIAEHAKIIGLGETGLDYYHDISNIGDQKKSFLNHIHTSQDIGLPVIVHTRNADSDTLNILVSEYRNYPFPGLIHCFSSNIDFARKILDIGFYISMSGVVTFKNAQILRDVVKYVPLDRLLIETDSPYLSPEPKRGQKNEPSFVTFVADKIAQIKEISFNEVAEKTTDNFFSLFSKAVR